MTSLTDHIALLLLAGSPRVSLGRLGSFSIVTSPARFDKESARFLPPSQKIFYDNSESDELTVNSLIVRAMSRAEGVSAIDMLPEVRNAVEAIIEALGLGAEIAIGNVGILALADNKLRFVEDQQFAPAPLRGFVPASFARQRSSATVEHKLPAAFENLTRVAAVVMFAVVFGLLFTTPTPVDYNTVRYASSGFTTISKPTTTMLTDSVALDFYIALPTEHPADTVRPSALPVADKADDGAYGLVVASLASEAEAQRFVGQNPDCELMVVHSGGRIRIVAARAETPQQILKIKASTHLGSRFPSAWPCRL